VTLSTANPGDVAIRYAVADDAAAIADIYNESIAAADSTMELTPKTEADIRALLSKLGDRERMLVLESNGRVEGWGILKRYSDREGYRFACETSVYLRREHVGKRTGFGSAIQAQLMNLTEELGYHHIVVKIWASNEVSIRMHEKFGFEIVGTQREIGLVQDAWRDVTIMQFVRRF